VEGPVVMALIIKVWDIFEQPVGSGITGELDRLGRFGEATCCRARGDIRPPITRGAVSRRPASFGEACG
jgi:hypothetical protein